MKEVIEQLILGFQAISWLEKFSVLCSIIQVLLSKNNKSSNYIFGILGIISGMYVLYDAKLYAEIALSMYYLVMSIYGWWYWKSYADQVQPISTCRRKDWNVVLTITILGFFILSFLLIQFTDSDVPYWDAWVSSTAWAGMWLLAKRKIENWIMLNISNLFVIPLQIHKGLYLFAALSIFLFIVAIFGYFKWKSILKMETASSN